MPAPYACSRDAILMEYIGDDAVPAQLRQKAALRQRDSRRAFDDVIRNIEILLACERVHGDLSAYNVLWWQGRVTLIDLPQAVEASSPDAYVLLEPEHVEFLQVAGTDNHKSVVGNAHDRQVTLHASGRKQQRTHAYSSYGG